MGKGQPRTLIALAGGSALLLASVTLGGAPAYAADELDWPTNVRVTDLDHTGATVAWDPVPAADNYLLVWTPAPPPEWVGWFDTTSTTAEFPISYPGARHYVSVVAQRGSESRATSIRFRAPKAPPPTSPPTPENVEADVSPGSVAVEWEPSFLDGEEADSYVVRWTPGHSGTVTSDTSITRNLPAGGDLEITVTARNDGSESEPSEVVEVTVPPAEEWEPLGPPTNLKVIAENDGTVTRIEWDPPTGGVEPITYKLNYRFADHPAEAWIAESTEPFIDVPVQIGELFECEEDDRPGQTWIIWVTAHSEGTVSPRSETDTICVH